MKAPAKKTKTPAKAKPKAAAKPAAKAKPAPKSASKPVKTASKPKPVAKPAAKAAKKAVAKPVAKKTGKPAPKPAVKAAKKPASKTPAKAPAKASPAKTPAKKAAAVPTPSKAKAIPSSKSAAAPKAAPAKPKSAAGAVTAKVQAAARPLPPSGAKATAAPTPAPVMQSNGLMAPPPLKPGRRSSARVATHSPPPAPMVPTHAPDAAKASYSTMTERVIAPPIQAAAKKDPKLANNWKTKPAEELSDDEVKAMPDSEYMNEKQMAFFRHKLSILKQEIHNSAGETTEHLREDTVVVPDPADRATIEEEHALELRTRDRERKLLKKIEQSIARIDSGDYGYCDETGEPIGVGRLIARPTANLSLEAQQRRELKQKMFGD